MVKKYTYTQLVKYFKLAGVELPKSLTPAAVASAGGVISLMEAGGLIAIVVLEQTGTNEIIEEKGNQGIDYIHWFLDKTYTYDRFTMISDFVINRLNITGAQADQYKENIDNFIRLDRYKMSREDILIHELASLQASIVLSQSGSAELAFTTFAYTEYLLYSQKTKLLNEGKEITIANLVRGFPMGAGEWVAKAVEVIEGDTEPNFGEHKGEPLLDYIDLPKDRKDFIDSTEYDTETTIDDTEYEFEVFDTVDKYASIYEEALF